MSGFLGLLRQDGRGFDEHLLGRIADQLRFRGPDAQNLFVERDLAACFTLLQVSQGRQSTRQPVVFDGRYWLLGENLIEDLAKQGLSSEANATDEELLLYAWKLWGPTSLERILGDFSFAIHDDENKTLWCVRDFIGARPFFYAHVPGVFAFSNTLDTLRSIPEISAKFDQAFLGDFLLHGFSQDPERTVYRDIRRLAPGHLLEYSGTNLQVRRFLTLPIEEPLHLKAEQDYLDAYRALLRDVVGDRMVSGKTALYLSGGLDSATVSAVAAQLAADRGQRRNLRAFTSSWRPLLEDREPEFAALSANHLGIAHEILEDRNFIPFFPGPARNPATPEPANEPFFSRSLRQYRRIAGYARVVLSGDGGDDVLTGQAWPYLVHLWSRRAWFEMMRTFGGFTLARGRIPPLRGGFRARISGLLKPEDQWKGYPDWLNPEFEACAGLRDRWKDRKDHLANLHPLHPQAYAALHRAYWGSVLESEDASWTRVPLETRAPMLDLRLLRFLLRVPPVPWCVNKELSRRALRSALPAAILRRPKTPLAKEPLQACIEQGNWRPELPRTVPDLIHRFVVYEKWLATLNHTKSYTYGAMFAPLALVQWVKAIENIEGIE